MNLKDPLVRALLILLIMIAGTFVATVIWQAVQHFSTIILLFSFAWLIAFLLGPLVRLLMLYNKVPRLLAIIVVYLGLIVLTIVASILIIPVLASQVAQLGANFPLIAEEIPPLLQNSQSWLEGHEISVDLSYIYQQQSLMQKAELLGTSLAQNAIGIAQGVVSTFLNTVIMIILSFYIMVDGGRIADALIDALPARARPSAHYFTESVERTFGGFMRGALIQGLVYGIGTMAVMLAGGLNYSVAVGVFAGLILIIPFIGSFLALVPPLVIAFLTGNAGTVIFVTVGLLILQQVVLNIIAPKVMSENVGIHPLLVFFAMLVGAQEAGIVGAIFGVPIAAVVYSMLQLVFQRAKTGGEGSRLETNDVSITLSNDTDAIQTGGLNEDTQSRCDSGGVGNSILTRNQGTAKGDVTAS